MCLTCTFMRYIYLYLEVDRKYKIFIISVILETNMQNVNIIYLSTMKQKKSDLHNLNFPVHCMMAPTLKKKKLLYIFFQI